MHFFKMLFRSALFLGYGAVYLHSRLRATGDPYGGYAQKPFLLFLIWLVFVVEMVQRFFPSQVESMGCQKQFRRNFLPDEAVDKAEPLPGERRGVALTVAAWLLLNGAIGGLYFLKLIDQGILLLVSLAYSICDMVCILYFCPFQSWFLKNKCCGTCRIYNWDYAMMFTPLIFIPNLFTWSLLVLALALLAEWEILYARHPERFYELTNRSLRCEHCQEKLCRHKKSIRRFLLQHRSLLKVRLRQTLDRVKDKERDQS